LDESIFELEQELFFRRTALLMAMSCELDRPGAYKTNDETGVPIVVIRSHDGTARAFLNACRHRGAKLMREPCGHRARMVCPYHAWAFDLNGKLVAISGEEAFGAIDKDSLGLIELPCQEKYGFIYVAPSREAEVDIARIIGDRATEFAGWHLDRIDLVGRKDIVADCSWKLALDTFCENYHFDVAHKTSLAAYKIANCGLYWRFGEGNRNHAQAYPDKAITQLRMLPEDKWENPQQHFSIIGFFYPNVMFSLFTDSFALFEIYPRGIASHVTKASFYTRQPITSPEMREMYESRFKFLCDVLGTEDYSIAAETMTSYRSGIYPYSVFGRNEPALTGIHEVLDAAISNFQEERQNRVSA
jgi:phenylpropionate dioxygenase-like ring-hydroxylating dioxygenase large terminal subunit